jgi:multicomponent Na+:H+ antiporter subunit E
VCKLVLFIVTFMLWLLLNHTLHIQFIITGVLVSILTTCLFGNIFVKNWNKVLEIKRYLWFLWYLIIFIWECLKANFDVAYRVLHPALPIKPGIVKAKVNLRTDIARAILANSITMTPGTLSVDITGEHLFIHCISIRDENPEVASQQIVDRFENILARIFE